MMSKLQHECGRVISEQMKEAESSLNAIGGIPLHRIADIISTAFYEGVRATSKDEDELEECDEILGKLS